MKLCNKTWNDGSQFSACEKFFQAVAIFQWSGTVG